MMLASQNKDLIIPIENTSFRLENNIITATHSGKLYVIGEYSSSEEASSAFNWFLLQLGECGELIEL